MTKPYVRHESLPQGEWCPKTHSDASRPHLTHIWRTIHQIQQLSLCAWGGELMRILCMDKLVAQGMHLVTCIREPAACFPYSANLVWSGSLARNSLMLCRQVLKSRYLFTHQKGTQRLLWASGDRNLLVYVSPSLKCRGQPWSSSTGNIFEEYNLPYKSFATHVEKE